MFHVKSLLFLKKNVKSVLFFLKNQFSSKWREGWWWMWINSLFSKL